MSPELYASSGGSICPACRGDDVTADEQVQMDGPDGTQAIICNNCKATWEDVVELRGYQNLSLS